MTNVKINYVDKAPGVPGDQWTASDANAFGRAINERYIRPTNGIDTGDLSSDVAGKLAKANTSIQANDLAAAQRVLVNSQTDNYTLALSDATNAVEMNKATSISVTVPPNSSVAFPVGSVIEVAQVGAGQVSIVAGTNVTVNPSGTKTRAQWSTLVLRKRATDSWLVGGDAA